MSSAWKLITTDNLTTSNLTTSGNVSASNINITGNLQLSGSSGVTNQYVKKTGVNTQGYSNIIPSDITTGTANQLLVKNSLGTSTVFTSDPIIPSSLTVNGTTNMVGNVQLNGANGSAGQVIKKINPSSQSWSSLAPSDLTGGSNEQSLWVSGTTPTFLNRSFRYGIFKTNLASQNWNASPLTSLSFTPGPATSSQTYGPSAFSNITIQTPNTTLLCNTTGYYMLSMYCCLTNAGGTSASVRFSILINGILITGGPLISLAGGESGTLSYSVPVLLSAGANLSFASESLSGASAINSDSPNSSLSLVYLQTIS